MEGHRYPFIIFVKIPKRKVKNLYSFYVNISIEMKENDYTNYMKKKSGMNKLLYMTSDRISSCISIGSVDTFGIH